MLNEGEKLIAKVDEHIANEIATLRHQADALKEALREVEERQKKYLIITRMVQYVLSNPAEEYRIKEEITAYRESL